MVRTSGGDADGVPWQRARRALKDVTSTEKSTVKMSFYPIFRIFMRIFLALEGNF